MKDNLAPALAAEWIGTFALIFIGAGAGALGTGGLIGVAMAHGFVVVGFAYAFGHISGTHINPAVTIGVWIAGKMNGSRAIAYVVVQTIGGIFGALALRYVLGGTETGLGATVLAQGLEAGAATITITPVVGGLIEAILTFFLVNAVLNAAISGRVGSMSGLSIGLTLIALILVGGPLTGASLNPARTLGPAVALGDFTHLGVYFAGPIFGAIVAAFLYRGVFEAKDRASR